MEFFAFGASPKRPVKVSFAYDTDDGRKEKKITATSRDQTSVVFPLPRTGRSQNITVNVPQAVSPKSLGQSGDSRILGIALMALSVSRDGDRASFTCLPPQCIQYRGKETIPGQVGSRAAAGIQTDRRAGYLMYGPYVPMNAGVYWLKVTGRVKTHGDRVIVDVVGQKGAKAFALFEGLGNSVKKDGDRVLLKKRVLLKTPVDDLEIRVRVDKEADILIDGYSFRQAKN